MKKNLLFCLGGLLSASLGLNAQNVIYSEDFQGQTMPANYILHDQDGGTPDASVNWCTNAWTVRQDFADTSNYVSGSISWYSPAGTSDDWMVVPNISISNTGTILKWKSMAQDPAFPDGYEVYISTTGTSVSDFTSTSSVFSTGADNSSWTEHSVNLDSYVGSTINIAFRNNSNDMFVLMVDDISIVELTANDVEMTSLDIDQYIMYPSQVSIKGEITNNGSVPVTSVDIKWTDGTSTKSYTLSGINIASQGTQTFTHGDMLALNNGSLVNLTVWLELNNDGNLGNDSLSTSVTGLSSIPTRFMVAEEATGTWCQWCPRGDIFMSQMLNDKPNSFIGIAVHNGDPMTNNTYDQNITGLTGGGWPNSVANRAFAMDPSDWPSAHPTIFQRVVPADVSLIAEHNSSNLVTIDVNTNFFGNVEGDYRLSVVVVENNVTGTSSSYDQANAYSGGAAGAMGGYESLPDPVPAAQMVYNHVGRELLGGWSGDAGSLPSTITEGSYSYQYTYQIPNGSNVDDFEFVGLLIDNSTGEILNGGIQRSFPVSVREIDADGLKAQVYPNPFTDLLNINLQLKSQSDVKMNIFNGLGELIFSKNFQSMLPGIQTLNFDGSDLNNGLYFVQITTDQGKVERRVILNR